MTKPRVCLQINVAPGDARYVTEILPHQLRTFGTQVHEIAFTLDTQQSRAFRSATDNYENKLAALRSQLAVLCKEYPHASLAEVDYSAACMSAVALEFTGGRAVPKKACDGSAFYAYLFGLLQPSADYVLHIDSDMLFGGGSQNWIAEAIALLQQNKDVLACYPFPGPPRADGTASRRRLISLWSDVSIVQSCVRSELQTLAFRYNELSTKVILIDRRRFQSGELTIPLIHPRWRRLIRSFWIGTSPFLLLEDCLTVLMNRRGLCSVAFLGSGNGMWSLHPRWRSKQFYAELPEIVRRVESGDIPAAQRGDFDMNASMIELSDVFRETTRWRRFRKEVRLISMFLSDAAVALSRLRHRT